MPIKFLKITVLFLIFHNTNANSAEYEYIKQPKELNRMEKLFVNTKFQLVYRKRELDPLLWKYLQENGIDEISDRGRAFNWDKNKDSTLPNSTILFAGLSPNISFVYYVNSRPYTPLVELLIIEYDGDAAANICFYGMDYSFDNIVEIQDEFNALGKAPNLADTYPSHLRVKCL